MKNLTIAITNKYWRKSWRFLTKHRGIKQDAWSQATDEVFDAIEDAQSNEDIRQALIKIVESFYN